METGTPCMYTLTGSTENKLNQDRVYMMLSPSVTAEYVVTQNITACSLQFSGKFSNAMIDSIFNVLVSGRGSLCRKLACA